MSHIPVLQKQVLEYLDPQPNQNFIDCTFGCGGHSCLILERIKPNGKVMGIEADKDLVNQFQQKVSRLALINDSYINLEKIVEENSFFPVHGILFDLGMSSWHINQSQKGFSFLKNQPLDMRYSLSDSLTAQEVVNKYSEKELLRILKDYGEERFASRIARNIVKQRKDKLIRTTFDLVDVIKRSVPFKYRRQKIHFATRTFQALRIAVNNELDNIEKGLNQAVKILNKPGRIVAISFHSLEDRIVKNFFKNLKQAEVLTKKPIKPSFEEVNQNKRARSAKLRAILIKK